MTAPDRPPQPAGGRRGRRSVATLAEHRSRQLGEEHLPPGLVRISVGCEDPEDLWGDLARALDRASRTSGGST